MWPHRLDDEEGADAEDNGSECKTSNGRQHELYLHIIHSVIILYSKGLIVNPNSIKFATSV